MPEWGILFKEAAMQGANQTKSGKLISGNRPIYLSVNRKNDAVILDIAEYNRLAELDLNDKLRQADEDIRRGKVYTEEQMFAHMNQKINAHYSINVTTRTVEVKHIQHCAQLR
jgi:hypothetical protein